MKKAFITTFIFTTFLLIGGGCSTTDTEAVVAPLNQVILKAPSSVIDRERESLYTPTREELFCENSGHTVITRFDQVSDDSRQFCRFSNGTECPLSHFVSGSCTAGSGVLPQVSGKHIDPIVSIHCEVTDPQVCGTNGHTYENRCLAVQTGVTIVHVGRCTESEIQAGTPPGASTQRKPLRITHVVNSARRIVNNRTTDTSPNVPPPATNDPAVATQGDDPAWLSTSIAFIESNPPTDPSMYIERCSREKNTYYLETNGTGNVPSVAYTKGGNTICYPNRDFTASCPDYVIARGSCSRVYTDNR